ncbi:MAG: hypothetical protein QMC79_01275 [Anaerosomatales bacterium]|nr:hypothetical protein [Anaerosomatales bacterium]
MIRRTALALVSAVVAALLAGCGTGGLPQGVVYPSIEPDPSVTEPLMVEHSFTFEGVGRSVTLAVDGALYAGARDAEKSVIRFGNARETDWIEDYYPAFVNEPHQDPFFEDLLGQLRAIRDREGLDPDRYAELLTVFVQSIPYATDPVDLSPKFPVETFVDRAGDCDDKTLLLAGLLSREGYDVAVLLFEPEQHVALGLRSDAATYRSTGYAYVETTTEGLVGMVPDDLAGGVVLTSEPRVFGVDGGTTSYGAGDEVTAILAALEESSEEAQALRPEVDAADRALATMSAEVDRLSQALDEASARGDVATYNALVDEYNDAAAAYNTATSERNALADRYNAAIAIVNGILERLDDRRGAYALIGG